MAKRRINKIAVIGSGIMGSGIACHFANIGVEVLLLDIVPRELNEKEKANLLYWQLTCRSFYTPVEWEWTLSQAGYTGDYSCIYFE